MLITDFIKKTNVQELSVEYHGETIDFHIKPKMGSDKEYLLERMAKVAGLGSKITRAKDEGKDYDLSGDEVLAMTLHKTHQAYLLMCDKTGKRIFHNYKAMTDKIEDDLLELMADKIEETLIEQKEDVEKNSETPLD